jgi:phosphatidylinositol alpha 1,6-mannosyltransferase
LVIAPARSCTEPRVTIARPYPVVRVASVPLPRYRCFRLGVSSARLTDALFGTRPTCCISRAHFYSALALPGSPGNIACHLSPSIRLRWPHTCVITVDWGGASATVWKWLRTIHNGADRTLAPSTTAAQDLNAVGWLAANPEIRQTYGAAGREAVQGRSWAEVGDGLIDHYHSVLVERAALATGLPVAA